MATLGLAVVMSLVVAGEHGLQVFPSALAAILFFLSQMRALLGALSFVQVMRWYMLRLSRRRESEADRMAKSICGTEATLAGIEFLAEFESAAPMRPLRPSLISCTSAVFHQFIALGGNMKNPEMIEVYFRWPSKVLGGAVWLMTRMPGADVLVQRLERTHPTIEERAFVLGIRLEPVSPETSPTDPGETGVSAGDDRAA